MKITSLRLTLVTTEGDVEVQIPEAIPPMHLVPGELVTLTMPILLDDENVPTVLMKRIN